MHADVSICSLGLTLEAVSGKDRACQDQSKYSTILNKVSKEGDSETVYSIPSNLRRSPLCACTTAFDLHRDHFLFIIAHKYILYV